MTGRQGSRKRGGPRQRRIGIGAALVALALALLLLPSAAAAQAPAPTLTTDKPDYAPGEVVHITGTGFVPGMTFTRCRSSGRTAVSFWSSRLLTWRRRAGRRVMADWAGNLSYDYQLDGIVGDE